MSEAGSRLDRSVPPPDSPRAPGVASLDAPLGARSLAGSNRCGDMS
jgi:hypothetical protein